jgi:hypothetical protein
MRRRRQSLFPRRIHDSFARIAPRLYKACFGTLSI